MFNSKIRSALFLLSFSASAIVGNTLGEREADACGPFEPQDVVADVVARHFDALNAHTRAPLLALWKEKASVVSLALPVVVEPVEQAATRWLSAKTPTTFHIDQVDVTDKTAEAIVSVVFEGVKHQDRMLLTSADGLKWRIAGKSSRPIVLGAGSASRRY